jgi:hypothetical protein
MKTNRKRRWYRMKKEKKTVIAKTRRIGKVDGVNLFGTLLQRCG